ncbi:MAG TPA: class I SAM-dependent methyltransferase, partial [Streptosporangiaceae bacterium]
MSQERDLRDSLARFEALLRPSGRELLSRLRQEELTPDAALRLGAELRAQYPQDLVASAFAQHELRLRARAKFSRAMDMFFTRPGLEQASSEVVGQHRRRRYECSSSGLADLCCGIGGDLIGLAEDHRVLAVDLDPLHLRMARANAEVYGVAANVAMVQGEVREVGLTGLGAAFIDPARRVGRRRLRPGDSEPPLNWCLGLDERVERVGIKAAPGLAREAVPPGWELEFIAIGRDLKEAVAWSPALATARTRATILPGGHTLTPGAGEPVALRLPGGYLLDPNPAVTRAGVVEDLARSLAAWKIDDQIAFLSADTDVQTPFARTLRVIDSAPWRQRQLPARLRALDIGAVDIRRRGLAGDVGELRRHLKLSGSRRATLVMTRVQGHPWGLV